MASNSSTTTPALLFLPTELQLAIFTHLRPQDIYALRHTHPYLHAILLCPLPSLQSMTFSGRGFCPIDKRDLATKRWITFDIEDSWLARSNDLKVCYCCGHLVRRGLYGKLKTLCKGCAEFARRREHRPHCLLSEDEEVRDAEM